MVRRHKRTSRLVGRMEKCVGRGNGFIGVVEGLLHNNEPKRVLATCGERGGEPACRNAGRCRLGARDIVNPPPWSALPRRHALMLQAQSVY